MYTVESRNQKQNKLKADSHKLKPIVIISHKGFTFPVHKEIDVALNTHELIKIKINKNEKKEREEIVYKICNDLSCTLIKIIGKIAVLYRKNI
ncbi:RNA-binding protein YhbY [Candidatus Kinetoplastibacterium blastocrithidii TCC012E]|uniref:RNA-binding protein YhbY n=1 Tax=Candidatus Kinetoplastidibacterium blastocrithidiae TCC012E TaxID=1208922 RepID=M1LZV0_9PROT|nr:YhbY family RNA-binding protein [Candidatus Kinetoplastibacterium blastocrithidii]AGF49591.1 RNA-binding protein YhbY [Candidatus Kinetoplastibacterium blastocrithidii TCC012E]